MVSSVNTWDLGLITLYRSEVAQRNWRGLRALVIPKFVVPFPGNASKPFEGSGCCFPKAQTLPPGPVPGVEETPLLCLPKPRLCLSAGLNSQLTGSGMAELIGDLRLS